MFGSVSTNEQSLDEFQRVVEALNRLSEDELVEIACIIVKRVTTSSALAEIETAVVDRWPELD